MPKRLRCEWCGALRLAKFIRRWPSGVGCKDEGECERLAIRNDAKRRAVPPGATEEPTHGQ
jgi:hypothetical protein